MLSNRVALVTGGTGSIGAAICRALARYGADVAFTTLRKEDAAAELAAELEATGRRCLWGRVDGRDGEAVEAFAARVDAAFGQLDVLVNNLGASQVLPFALIDEEDWDLMVQVNLKGLFLFTRAVARRMIRCKRGVILNLGSLAGHRLLEVPVHYATAKAGVTGFTLALAKELARHGIRVNEITPGLVEGGIGHQANERQLRDYNQFCAMGRPGKPDEVAELVAFLASDRASYINAQSIVIDGGL